MKGVVFKRIQKRLCQGLVGHKVLTSSYLTSWLGTGYQGLPFDSFVVTLASLNLISQGLSSVAYPWQNWFWGRPWELSLLEKFFAFLF